MHTHAGRQERAPGRRPRVGSRARWALLVSVGLLSGAFGGLPAAATESARSQVAQPCDRTPTGVDVQDEYVSFTVPAGLMPDARFDGRQARIQVHSVRPVYAHGKCSTVRNRTAVLVHGSRVSGTPSFDLRHDAPDGGTLSAQRALAEAGIDTFAPSLLGYGRSTRFADGLDDPGNASLRPYNTDGSCSHPEGCDRAHLPIFPLDQQGSLLLNNPLDGERLAHSSGERFARTDVFVRDLMQVVDHAIQRARPSDGKVSLIGWSFGANYAARTLHKHPEFAASKVNSVVFHASGPPTTPTEEVTPAAGSTSFPTNLATRNSIVSGPTMPPGRAEVCTGHRIPGTQEQLWNQMMEEDPLGRTWGGTGPATTVGVHRSPTFSLYGWNTEVAQQLTTPALVIHGTDDTVADPDAAPAIYENLGSARKILVQVECGSHLFHLSGCSGDRCTSRAGVPYGGRPGDPFAGPYSTYQTALIEWITRGTFNNARSGRFEVDDSGVAHRAGRPQ